jgi:hypothetical protein
MKNERNRIRPLIKKLVGVEDPEDLILELLEVLTETTTSPEVGKYYTFIYAPKTPGLRYDAHPFVAVTSLESWGFRGINFHWPGRRQYTTTEVRGSLHLVRQEEVKDLRSIPFGVMRLNR